MCTVKFQQIYNNSLALFIIIQASGTFVSQVLISTKTRQLHEGCIKSVFVTFYQAFITYFLNNLSHFVTGKKEEEKKKKICGNDNMMEMVRNQSQWEGYFLQYLSFIMFVKFLRNYVYCEKPDLTQLFDNVSHQTIKMDKMGKTELERKCQTTKCTRTP